MKLNERYNRFTGHGIWYNETSQAWWLVSAITTACPEAHLAGSWPAAPLLFVIGSRDGNVQSVLQERYFRLYRCAKLV